LADELRVSAVSYPDWTHACAGLNSTALELGRFVGAVAAGHVVGPSTVEMMWTPQKLADGGLAMPDPETRFGLGWMIERMGESDVVGGTGGAACAFRHHVDSGVTAVVLTNTQGSNPDGLATRVLGIALGGSP
jgi:hypothetical protein